MYDIYLLAMKDAMEKALSTLQLYTFDRQGP